MTETAQEYIWVSRWDEFQTYTTKRGKPWVPPWIKIYPHLLDEPAFLDLTPETRMVLVGIWLLFGRSRGTIAIGTRNPHEGLKLDTRRLSRQLSQRVTKRQLESLNHAGFIQFCSGTVREQLWNRFWNSSAPEVEEEEETEREEEKNQEQDQNPHPTPPVARPPDKPEPEQQNGLGGVGGDNDQYGPQPIGQTVDEILAALRGAA